MASSSFPATGSSFNFTTIPAIRGCNNQKLNLINNGFHHYPAARFPHLNCKDAKNDRNTKPNNVICGDYDRNAIGSCCNQKLNLINNGFHHSSATRFPQLNGKAAENYRNTKPNSVICGDYDRNAIGSCNNQKLNLISNGFHHSPATRFPHLNCKADHMKDRNTKPNSVICGDCDGNGAVLCSQCKGNGVNAVDFFNGQFKAGASCWLCGGKKEMLCGNL